MGVGREDFQQSWELPRIAIDGPFGTASEVSGAIVFDMIFSSKMIVEESTEGPMVSILKG